MTIQEATQKAQDWQNLLDEADCEEQNNCTGAAERIRNEARAIEQELEAAGYMPLDLLSRKAR